MTTTILTERGRLTALRAARLFDGTNSAMHISERTAQNHVQHILTKLGFQNRSQIAAWTTRQGLATPPA